MADAKPSPRSGSTSSPGCGRSSPRRGPTGPTTSAGPPRRDDRRRPRAAPSARGARTARRPRSGRIAPAAASRTRPAGGPARSPTSTRRWRRPGRTTRPPRRRGRPSGRLRRRRRPAACQPRAAGSPTSSRARPATGVHEVIVNSPAARDRDGQLDDERVRARRSAAWRERMRAHRESAAYVQLIVNEGGEAGASLEHSHAQLYALPFVPAAVARERERVGAYNERTAGRRPARRDRLRGGAPRRAAGRDRRRGGADLPLGLALALRAAGHPPPARAELRAGREVGRGDAPHRAAGARGALRRRPRSSTSGSAPRRAAPSTSTGTSTSRRGSAISAGFELVTGVDINIYPPERAAADLREALG